MRGFTILVSLFLIIVLVGVAGGGQLLWGLGLLSWLAITLAVIRGGQVEQEVRWAEWQEHGGGYWDAAADYAEQRLQQTTTDSDHAAGAQNQ
jgi:hypothetical protein